VIATVCPNIHKKKHLYLVVIAGWYRVVIAGWYRVVIAGWYRVVIAGWYRVVGSRTTGVVAR